MLRAMVVLLIIIAGGIYFLKARVNREIFQAQKPQPASAAKDRPQKKVIAQRAKKEKPPTLTVTARSASPELIKALKPKDFTDSLNAYLAQFSINESAEKPE